MKTQQEKLQELYKFLDELKESGKTNMLAAPKFIEEYYGYKKEESKMIFDLWVRRLELKAKEQDLFHLLNR